MGFRVVGPLPVSSSAGPWLCAIVILAALSTPMPGAESERSEVAAVLIREGLHSLELGKVERATRQFERAVQLRPAHPTAYMHLARAHGVAHRLEQAHAALAKAEIHARGSRKVRYRIELLRGDLYRDTGDRARARASYERAKRLRFRNREARQRLEALEAQAPPVN